MQNTTMSQLTTMLQQSITYNGTKYTFDIGDENRITFYCDPFPEDAYTDTVASYQVDEDGKVGIQGVGDVGDWAEEPVDALYALFNKNKFNTHY